MRVGLGHDVIVVLWLINGLRQGCNRKIYRAVDDRALIESQLYKEVSEDSPAHLNKSTTHVIVPRLDTVVNNPVDMLDRAALLLR